MIFEEYISTGLSIFKVWVTWAINNVPVMLDNKMVKKNDKRQYFFASELSVNWAEPMKILLTESIQCTSIFIQFKDICSSDLSKKTD
jgi:hypothetical protein